MVGAIGSSIIGAIFGIGQFTPLSLIGITVICGLVFSFIAGVGSIVVAGAILIFIIGGAAIVGAVRVGALYLTGALEGADIDADNQSDNIIGAVIGAMTGASILVYLPTLALYNTVGLLGVLLSWGILVGLFLFFFWHSRYSERRAHNPLHGLLDEDK